MFPVYGSRFPLAPVSACYSSVYEGIFAKNTKFEKFVSLYSLREGAQTRPCAMIIALPSFRARAF